MAVTASVLVISHGFQPNYEKAFANGLAAHDVRPTLIASDRTLVKELSPAVEVLNIRGSQDPRRSRLQKATNLLRYGARLLALVASRRHDVVHLTGTFLTSSVLAGLLEWCLYWALARRFVMTVHNILPHGRHGKGLRLLYRLVYRLPQVLVVHTHKMRSDLEHQFGIAPGRIVVMAHGVDEVPTDWAAPLPADHLRVLIFGGLNHYKGVDQFLRAASLVARPMVITIAGEARDASHAELVSTLISTVPERHRVDWRRGFIAEDKVQQLFEANDVVVLPYRHIDQSGVLFTAFRFGAPLIVTDVGSFRESLPSFAGVVARSADPADLADGVNDFIGRQPAFDRRRIRAHAQSLCWPNTVTPLLAVYAGTGA
ncbi:glycosyltransferase [Pelomonas sp. UHG3]|uniref:Glycosyltransferase n=1 Tax=Roseateles hydrophilus TaxID=2975054 RepID=A0ACC6C567_9BURK|nr:glycosyltransferase [Pelomonas sp. UHG3]MCY4743530.1 glycosyltransferase [Pelomonas sp. UHG3]